MQVLAVFQAGPADCCHLVLLGLKGEAGLAHLTPTPLARSLSIRARQHIAAKLALDNLHLFVVLSVAEEEVRLLFTEREREIGV